MAVSNYNTNKLVYIYKSEVLNGGTKHEDKKTYERIEGPKNGGFVLDSESSLNIVMEFTNSYGDILDKLTAGAKAGAKTAGGGLLSTVKGVGEALSGGRYKLMNTNVKTWEGTSPLTIPSTLKFKFYYGIKDVYNCKTEVWDPIKALVTEFAPKVKDTNFVRFDVPTLGQAMAHILYGAVNDLSTDKINSLFEPNQQEATSTETSNDNKENNNNKENNSKVDIAGKIDDTTMGIIEAAYSTVDEALGSIKSISKMFQIRIGQLIFSNLYIGNVKWEFDYQQVDENGYPYKGTVELKNISTSEYTTVDFLNRVMP